MKFIFLKISAFFLKLGFVALPMSLIFLFVCLLICERAIFFFLTFDEKMTSKKLISILDSLSSNQTHIKEDVMSLEFGKISTQLMFGMKGFKFCAAISPLLGLLGTVTGMIRVFGAMSDSTTAISPAVISAGLEEVMYATAAGLFIAVISIFSHFIFSAIIKSKIDAISLTVNKYNIELAKEEYDKFRY